MSEGTEKALLEIFESKLAGVLEGIDQIRVNTNQIPDIAERLTVLEEKVETIEFAVAETNKDVKGVDKALGNLEHRIDTASKKMERQVGELDVVKSELQKLERDSIITNESQLKLSARVTKLESA